MNSHGILRTISLIFLAISAAGSLVFTFNAGRNNDSILLVALFVVWILSPFAALLLANTKVKLGPDHVKRTIYWLMIVLSIGSLVAYSRIIHFPGTSAGFIFVVGPAVFWLIILITVFFTRSRSR